MWLHIATYMHLYMCACLGACLYNLVMMNTYVRACMHATTYAVQQYFVARVFIDVAMA